MWADAQPGSHSMSVNRRILIIQGHPDVTRDHLCHALAHAYAAGAIAAGIDARIADIDRAMELGYRHPMGPLKLTDLVGLDVRLAILEHLTKEIGEQFRPPAILRQMVRAGKLGKKTGEGFYRWTDGGPVPSTIKR